MKACGLALIINESCLGIFQCQNIWKRRPDGLFQLKLTLDGTLPYLEKYAITYRSVEGRDFNQLIYQDMVIGIAQPIYSWDN